MSSIEARSNEHEHIIAGEAFDDVYGAHHPDYTQREVEIIRENSGLDAIVNGEDLPLGSLDLISSRHRRERARKIGERLGRLKD